jgi:hypothetical protein
MKGNFAEYEELAVELINNHAGFLPEQEKERILHLQFTLSAIYDQGYHQSTKDLDGNNLEEV